MRQGSLFGKGFGEERSFGSQSEGVGLEQSLLTASGLAIIVTTPEGIITTFNAAAEHLLGYSAGELVGKSTPIIFHDTDEIARRADETAKKTGKKIEPPFDVLISKLYYERSSDWDDWTFIRKDGSRFMASLSVVSLQDDQGKLTGFAGVISDRTEQQKLKEQVALSERKFKLLAENIPGAIYLCENDTDYSIIYLSDHIETITGYSAKDFIAKKVTFASLLHPEDQDRIVETFRASGPETKSVQCSYRLRHATRGWRWVNETRVGVYEGNHLAFLEGFLQDITSQKELTLQLQDQNRRLDEFAHIISHNLRAPVNNIQALINLLDEKSEITDYRLIFDKLKNVSKNLSETMNELMDTLKAKTQPEVDLTEIRFKEVLDKVVQSLEGELIVAQAAVTFDFNEAPTIHYSKPYLESIFQNLLTNAIKYRSTHRKPLIHFKTSLVGNHLELQVSDNGQGIDMARFGDKLFGLHKTFHEHQEARGVGLFLIKTQIEALGGSISVNSEVDKGTTFIIRFS